MMSLGAPTISRWCLRRNRDLASVTRDSRAEPRLETTETPFHDAFLKRLLRTEISWFSSVAFELSGQDSFGGANRSALCP
jgi:hypothetical protein